MALSRVYKKEKGKVYRRDKYKAPKPTTNRDGRTILDSRIVTIIKRNLK
jgi:hypothetical protein